MYVKFYECPSADFFFSRNDWGSKVEVSDTALDGFMRLNITNSKPVLQEGEVIAYHIVIDNGVVNREYVAMSPSDPRIRSARTYRVGDLFWWVHTKGKSEELDALLKARGLYTAAIAQTTVSDGDPNFTTILDSIASELGFTEEDIAEALKGAVV